MNDLLRDTLRATADRIVVGEVRNGEALALLKAWNTGYDGGCSVVPIMAGSGGYYVCSVRYENERAW